jgi:hypothetical protein
MSISTLATFTADGGGGALACSPDGRSIVAGDGLGRMHFLRLEVAEDKSAVEQF